ncbi:MAG: cold shock domain-containing protein [Gordonia sp. (in: high G+C Gram-positive bacteria)]|uniref:cold-shock protein n=1 Tax=Gordonia sp. (in: high G+C Gram-positive bacteria) TaxID=84139 RepID=UPI0039E43354
MAVSGKIVHFDPNKGFGFVAPEEGGADVFIHINDLDIDESKLRAGAVVEFDVEDTDRGAKATNVVLTQEAPPGGDADARAERRSDFRRDDRRDDHRRDDRRRDDRRDDRHERRERRPRSTGHGSMDAASFNEEITEILLDTSGSLTAAQIVLIRQRVTDFAVDRGWVLD